MPELIHGRAVQLAPHLRRLTAPNPGVMTGAGTNTYLLGEREVAVLDPGPDLPEHVSAIEQAIAERGGRLARVIATHTHVDHSPAAKSLLARAQGPVEVIGALASDTLFQDADFAPDTECRHEQWFETAEYRVQAIATPGHVDNHFCFLHEASGTVMTGDHIMNGSTVVIVPPSGDMAAYIRSLQCLLNYPLQQLAPGHGDVMPNPREVIQGLVDHRLGREAKVISVLEAERSGTLVDLVVPVYDDVDPSLHPIAQLSLLAHLIKLQGRARPVSRTKPGIGFESSTAMHKFACYIGDAQALLARRVTAGILYVFQGCATQPGATGRAEMVSDTCAHRCTRLSLARCRWVAERPASLPI